MSTANLYLLFRDTNHIIGIVSTHIRTLINPQIICSSGTETEPNKYTCSINQLSCLLSRELQGAAIVPPFSISPATEVDSASDAETADRDDLSSFPN